MILGSKFTYSVEKGHLHSNDAEFDAPKLIDITCGITDQIKENIPHYT